MKKILFVYSMLLIFLGCGTKLTSEQKSIKKVLSDYTSALQKGDIAAAYNKIAQVSKNEIPLQEFTNKWTKNLTEFKIKDFSIENITILEINSKRYATAIIKRTIVNFTNNKKEDVRLDYHLVEEDSKWGILRTTEINEKIKKYLANGDTLKAHQIAKICIEIDPFVAITFDEYIASLLSTQQTTFVPSKEETQQKMLNKDVINSFPAIEKSKTHEGKFITELKDKGYDGSRFFIKYTVSSKSLVQNAKIKAVWRKPSSREIIDESSDYISLEPGYTKSGELHYWPSDEISQVQVDIYISYDFNNWELIQKDINISIPSIAEAVEFTITGTSYQKTLAADFTGYCYAGRIDYKITNVSDSPIDRLVVKVVWYMSGTSEILDQTLDYVLSSGDMPLKPQDSKIDYITCGKGFSYGYTDLTADIYVSRYYDRYELIRKGVVIK